MRIALTLDEQSVKQLDRGVAEGRYHNRSRALQKAVNLLVEREKRQRLARELEKLDPATERRLSEEDSR